MEKTLEEKKFELIDKLSNCLHSLNGSARTQASDIGYLMHKIIHADSISIEIFEEVAKKQISSK